MARIEDYNVSANDQIVVRGKVAFSRVANMIDGEELQAKVKRDTDRGSKYPTNVPHTTISLYDVELEDRYKGTPLANFYSKERLYKSQKGKHPGSWSLSLDSKSPTPPRIWQVVDGEKTKQIEIDADFAEGQEVAIVISAYESKKYANMGSSFNDIIVPKDVKFYQGGGGVRKIEAFGEERELNPAGESSADSNPVVRDVPEDKQAELPDALKTVPADAAPTVEEDDDNPFV